MKRIGMLFVMTLAACSGERGAVEDVPATSGAVEPAEIVFAPELGVELAGMTQLGDGVYIRDLRQGSGAVADSGVAVTVAYRAWLPDGTLFEQRPSDDGFSASEFVLGENAPVPGLDSGMRGMRTGGVRLIVVPPALGYDLIGRPEGVPSDATLVFEVTLRRAAS